MARLGRAQPFRPLLRRALVAAASGNVTVALTGVAGTCVVNAVGVAFSLGLVTTAGTGAAGTVAPSATAALTGVTATGVVGTVVPSAAGSASLTGTSGTGAVGTLVPSSTVALTGVAGTGAAGTVSQGANRALSGTTATGAAGTVAPASTVPLTGAVGTGAVGSVTASGAGVSSLSGTAATGVVGTLVPAHSHPLSGVAATGAVGTVTPGASNNVTVALTGVQAQGQVGNVRVAGTTPPRRVTIRRLRQSPYVGAALTLTRFDRFTLDIESGRGLVGTESVATATPGITPTFSALAVLADYTDLTLRYSGGTEALLAFDSGRQLIEWSVTPEGVVITPPPITPGTTPPPASGPPPGVTPPPSGTPLTTGSSPQLMLQWSDDGGHTWSDEEWVDAGRLGDYQHRAVWRRLGRARQRVFRVTVSDPIKWVLVDAFLKVT